jgi:DNA topoisomerase-1
MMKKNPTVQVASEAARNAHLRYVHDDMPGISRIKSGKGFIYKNSNGRAVSKKDMKRIEALAIPPAYHDVWICPYDNGHIQATGLDDRNRKQYRYHAKWREVRDEKKYDKMLAFGNVLPAIRRHVTKDLQLKGLPKEKVLATVVSLLEKTLIRVGNEEYVKENKSYGLTTMHTSHVQVRGSKIQFEFKGKSGVYHQIDISDPRLAKIVRECQDIPGYELFQYLDENGMRHSIHSEDVNAYLRDITNQDFTAKDFRTWHGTVLATQALLKASASETDVQAKRIIVSAIESVARQLGNTKAVCRKSYIHPLVLKSYLDNSLRKSATAKGKRGLHVDEHVVMKLLAHAA